jgi:hypothetical protein
MLESPLVSEYERADPPPAVAALLASEQDRRQANLAAGQVRTASVPSALNEPRRIDDETGAITTMPATRIRAEVQVPSHLVIPRGKKKVSLEVVALIHNDSEDHYVMGATDPSEIHCWQILDSDSREVARIESAGGKAKKVRGATLPYCSTLVPSGLCLREHETLVVDGSKLRDGRRYTVRHTHWGLTDEAEFVAVVEPDRARPAKKPKKAAKKAGSRKKTARKKTAKKAAKKKTPKRGKG